MHIIYMFCCCVQACVIYLCGTKKDLLNCDSRHNAQIDYHNVRDYADGLCARLTLI